MSESKPIFDPPRWPGGPKICVYENLPSFVDEAEIKAFNLSCGDRPIEAKWQCSKCGCWHVILKPQSPAGDSSGNGRPFTYNTPRYGR